MKQLEAVRRSTVLRIGQSELDAACVMAEKGSKKHQRLARRTSQASEDSAAAKTSFIASLEVQWKGQHRSDGASRNSADLRLQGSCWNVSNVTPVWNLDGIFRTEFRCAPAGIPLSWLQVCSFRGLRPRG